MIDTLHFNEIIPYMGYAKIQVKYVFYGYFVKILLYNSKEKTCVLCLKDNIKYYFRK